MALHLAGYTVGLPSLIMLLSAALSVGVSGLAWRRRAVRGAAPLALLEAATAWWSAASALELAAPTVAQTQFWGQVAYLGVATSPLFYGLFSIEYARLGGWLTRRRVAGLAVLPIITILLAATNDWHHWHWAAVSIAPESGLVAYARGPWFWVHVAYSYALLLAGVAVLVRTAFILPPYYRPQALALLVGSTPPLVANVVYLSDRNPLPGLDWTPLALALTGVALAWGLLRTGLLHLIPIARHQLIDNMNDGILVVDPHGQVVDANRAAARLLGRPDQALIGQSAPLALPAWPDAAGARASAEFILQPDDGRVLDAATSALWDAWRQPLGWLVILRDVTERERAAQALQTLNERLQQQLDEVRHLQAKLREEAIRDPLTGAFNRRYLSETLPRELAVAAREGKPLCVVMLDLDHFKQLNDTFGHAAGDVVLRELVALVGGQVRQGDAVCRYGGEEFVVVMSNIAAPDAQRRAEAWRAAFAVRPLRHADETLAATISLGIAAFPAHAAQADDLLDLADRALYLAKSRGRNRVTVWEPGPADPPR